MSNELYKSTYEGKLSTDLATIEEGRVLMGELQKNSPRFRGGMGLPEASLLAIGSNGGPTAIYIPIAELIDNGFPENKPIHLQLKIEQGAKRSTDDDFGDEYINPFRTTNGIMLEVRDCLDMIGKYGDVGLQGIFNEIMRAAGLFTPKVIFAPPVITKGPDVEPTPGVDPTHDAPVHPPVVDPVAVKAPAKGK